MSESIEVLKEKYPNEWLAVVVTKEREWEPLEGELVAHAKTRAEIHSTIRSRPKSEIIYVLFSGQEIDPNVALAL